MELLPETKRDKLLKSVLPNHIIIFSNYKLIKTIVKANNKVADESSEARPHAVCRGLVVSWNVWWWQVCWDKVAFEAGPNVASVSACLGLWEQRPVSDEVRREAGGSLRRGQKQVVWRDRRYLLQNYFESTSTLKRYFLTY